MGGAPKKNINMTIEYKILAENDLRKLEALVKEYTRIDWQLHGELLTPVRNGEIVFVQALIRRSQS